MQAPTNSSGSSVVQWVIPPSARPKTRSSNGLNSNEPNVLQVSNSFNEDNTRRENLTSYPRGRQLNSDSVKPVINMSVCRTICIFVDEHLRELRVHQQLINEARSRFTLGSLHNPPEFSDPTFIARSDMSKLRIRDEQTKAIETIKQLTNYLRELAYLKRLCDASSEAIDEETINKLSDIRAEIIQALNDFVLSNHDIDVPIIDPEDFTQNGYDLCADASTSFRQDCIDRMQNSCSSTQDKKTSTFDGSSIEIINSSSNTLTKQYSNQSVILANPKPKQYNMRQREIQKIEKDTVELRQLFSDFYNLVKAQNEQVDSIENNIVIATHRISEGHHNISKTMKGLTILVPVTGCMAGALIGGPIGIVVGGKLGGLTIGIATSLLGLLSSYSAQRHISCIKIKDD